MISASVLTASETPVTGGDVIFNRPDGNTLVKRGARSATMQLVSGTNLVNATFVNNRGQILQASLTINAEPLAALSVAVVWDTDGRVIEIPMPPDVVELYPKAINDRGEVAGTARLKSTSRAFIWSAQEGFRILAFGSEDYSEASGINDDGVVTGSRRVAGRIDGFLWSRADGFRSITSDTATTVAVAINESGIVAGVRNHAAVTWSMGSGFTELVTPKATQCSGTSAIGNAGHVVGWAGTDFDDGWCFHWSPVMWEPDGSMRTIFDCSSQQDCSMQVVDVNGAGEVIGNRNGRPFKWNASTGFKELLGDATGVAAAINERGEVAGEINYPTPYPIVWTADNTIKALALAAGRTTGTVVDLNNKGQAVGRIR